MKKLLAILTTLLLLASQAWAALPNQLKTARMTDATLASTIDNEVGNLEQAVCDILGIPCNTNISNALFTVTASGLTKVIFQNLAADPTAAGELARNATVLKFHDGTAARTLVDTATAQTLAGPKTLTSPVINDPVLTIQEIADPASQARRIWINTLSTVFEYWDNQATPAQHRITADDVTATLTLKTIALGSNTISGTTAQFNTALTDGDFATIAGIETLTGKSLTTPTISSPTITGAAPATPTANVLYSDLVVKGWVETSGGGAWTIDADVNVSSITDNGVGDFTINWATAFAAGANYAVVGMAIDSSVSNVRTLHESTATAKSTTAVRIVVLTGGAIADPTTGVSVIAIGAQ